MRSNEDHVEALLDEEGEKQRLGARGPRHGGRVDPVRGEDINQRMAAMRVRSWGNRHACAEPATGECTHPNHRRDAHGLLSTEKDGPGLLDMLGLPHEYPAYTEDEKRMWLRWIGQSGPPDVVDGLGLDDAA